MTEQDAKLPRRFAAWHERVLAYLADVIPLPIVFVVLALLDDNSGSSDTGFTLQVSGLLGVLYYVIVLGWFAYNWLFRQGTTGQTVGKKAVGIAVLDASQRPIGPGLTFVRQLAHVLDSLPCLIGYLWPLWDGEKRTFADMIMGTRVLRV
jgi:uncharacterized RDD family membrane protein YckC